MSPTDQPPNLRKLLCLLLLMGLGACKVKRFQAVVLPDTLDELSGLCYQGDSRIWGHNDSDNPAVLYQFTDKGEIADSLGPYGVEQIDWEALAEDPEGNIYIGDIGNNRLGKRSYIIYKYKQEEDRFQILSFSLPSPLHSEEHYNFEAMFWYQDSLWVFSKSSIEEKTFQTAIFTIPDKVGAHVAQFKGHISLKNFAVTGAGINRSSHQIALVGYRLRKFLGIPRLPVGLYLIESKGTLPFWKEQGSYFNLSPWGIGKPVEAIDCVNGDTWILGSERSPIHKAQIQIVKIRRKPQR